MTQGDWMEEVMNTARRRGDFDNLPGKGRPLALGDANPFASEDEMAYRLLKEAGFTPEWVELRTKIVAEIAWLREHVQHPERPSRIVAANLLISQHNRQVPNPTLAYPKLPASFPR